MGNRVTGERGGKPVVVAVRLTQAEAEKFWAKCGILSQSEALRLAITSWKGLQTPK